MMDKPFKKPTEAPNTSVQPPRTPAPPAGPAPLPPASPRDASLTGQEPRTSRNQMTSEGAEPVAVDATAVPAPEKPRQPGKDASGQALPVLETYPEMGNGTQEICLDGGGGGNGARYLVGKPIPQDLTIGSDTYNLSDRAKGLYTFRVK